MISTEGCYACKGDKLTQRRRKIGKRRRGHRLRHMRSKQGSNNRRGKRHAEQMTSVNHLQSSDLLESVFQVNRQTKSRNHSYGKKQSKIIRLTLKKKDISLRRRILFLQPSVNDLMVSYSLRGQDKDLFGISEKDNIWGLYFKGDQIKAKGEFKLIVKGLSSNQLTHRVRINVHLRIMA